jgi:hypothetical protein
MILFRCQVCQKDLKVRNRHAGQKMYCPNCCRPSLAPARLQLFGPVLPPRAAGCGTPAGRTPLDAEVAAKLERAFRRGRLGGARGRVVWEGMRRLLGSKDILAALGGPERFFAGEQRAALAAGDDPAGDRLREEALKLIRRWRTNIGTWIKVNTGQRTW